MLGTAIGYALSSAAFFLLGVLALRAYGAGPGNDVVGALLAVPAGAAALIILAAVRGGRGVREHLLHRDPARRTSRPGPTGGCSRSASAGSPTVLALAVDGGAYEPFLFLIGAVFVPLAGTLVVDFALSRGS